MNKLTTIKILRLFLIFDYLLQGHLQECYTRKIISTLYAKKSLTANLDTEMNTKCKSYLNKTNSLDAFNPLLIAGLSFLM